MNAFNRKWLLGLLVVCFAIITQSKASLYIKGRYDLLNPESLHPDHMPRYSNAIDPNTPIHRLTPLPQIDLQNKTTSKSPTKRSAATTTTLNITSSFQLQFTCQNTNSCYYAELTFVHAAQRLAQVLSLPATIIISATFESFCMANAADCNSSTLGLAAPASFHTWSDVAASALGVDVGYSYPSALAKQLAPNDTTWGPSGAVGSTVVDIFARFNADFPWWVMLVQRVWTIICRPVKAIN